MWTLMDFHESETNMWAVFQNSANMWPVFGGSLFNLYFLPLNFGLWCVRGLYFYCALKINFFTSAGMKNFLVFYFRMTIPVSVVAISDVPYTPLFQGAEESDMPVTSNVSPESNEKNIPAETVSPSSNVQIPTTTVAPPTSTADNISTLNSLRGVRLIIIIKLFFIRNYYQILIFLSLSLSYLFLSWYTLQPAWL